MKKNNLAKKLKELRGQRGMSQEYLADESKVSLRTIQRIENNESVPTGETIKRISIALGVEINELVGNSFVPKTNDLKATIVFLKKQLSKTNEKSEIKFFENFIHILIKLQDKDLTSEQLEGIESYLKYLELEKIPSFSNEMFKGKLNKFKKFLKVKLRFVPKMYYTNIGLSFIISFLIGVIATNGIGIWIIVFGVVFSIIFLLMDLRIKKQGRSFSF